MIIGWYRVVLPAGNQLSQQSNSDFSGHCNTENGGVLIGDHPDEAGKIVDMKISFGRDTLSFGTSEDLIDIRVLNCNQFYLYELESANAKERYCTEMNMKNVDIQKMLQDDLSNLKNKSENL